MKSFAAHVHLLVICFLLCQHHQMNDSTNQIDLAVKPSKDRILADCGRNKSLSVNISYGLSCFVIQF